MKINSNNENNNNNDNWNSLLAHIILMAITIFLFRALIKNIFENIQ